MRKSRTENVMINSIAGIGQKFVTIVTNFLIQLIFIKTLGAQYAGVSALFTSILTVLSFAELGIGTAITFNLYKPIAEKDKHTICAYMNFYANAYRVVALSVLLMGLLSIPLIPLIVTNVPDITENIIAIYLLFVIDTAASYLLVYKSTLLNASQENHVIALVNGTMSIIKCVLVCALLLIWKSYYAYLITTIGITVAQNIIISHEANKRYPYIKGSKDKLGKGQRKRIFKDVFAMCLYKVSGVVLNGTDNIIISRGIGTSSVGILSNYNLIIKQVYDVIIQFFSSATSSIGNLTTEKDEEYQHSIFEQLNFIAFWIFSFCSIALFVIINPFIKLCFGEEYLFPMAVTAVLVADFYVKGMMNPASSFRNSHGLFVQGKYRPLLMAILNIVISIVLLWRLGIIGVFLGTVISRILTQVWFDPLILYRYVFKRSPWRFYRKYLLWLSAMVVSCALSYFLAEWIRVSSMLLTVVIRAFICLMIPNAIIILCYHRTSEFKNTMAIGKTMLHKIKKKLVRKGGST